MGKIQIGRENKRDYESVKFFTESVKPEKELADEVQQPTEQAEEVADAQAEQARQETEVQQPAKDEKPSAAKEKVPVAKPKRKGGKR